ncbi:hypothetical protein Bca52824_080734 [Brassica carinata]|uniref:Aminotransferase-like plant mobile domain-containing protein n=1 Tax=Brassica carinata TaxID=52824 RepID=A0A8X7PHD2_BRACI|nr:hypothetical protein Bca52824_080734 [Brassica carinata]
MPDITTKADIVILDLGEEETKAKVEREWVMLKKDLYGRGITQPVWMKRFMDSGDELEHVAFLVLWLSYFVFPPRSVFQVAVHLSSGTRIALAPAVLAHLYADLSLLKDHTRAFTRSKSIELSASLFKLVQVWTWERFRELRPRPNLLLEGQPRLALWDEVKQGKNDVRKILDNSSFEWRPYTKAVENWKLPKFYPEKAMWVPVGPDLDEELISFARCIKACELVGMDSVEHYFPNRVASQFGMLQDAPSPPPVVNRNNLSREAAREEYNKAIDDLTLYILSRVTPTFCDWWKEKGVVESSETLKSRNIVGDLGPKKRKRIRENNDEEDVSEPLCRKCRLAAANVDKDVTPPEREQRKGTDETGSKAGKRVVLSPSHPPSSALGRAMGIVISSTKSCDDERCESIVQKMTLIDYVTKETEFSLHEGGAITGDKESSESLIHNDETGWKNMVRSPNNSSDPLRGFDDATHDTHVSPPLETRQTCDDEIDVHGSNVEKMTVPDDGNKEPECLLHEDGGMSGGEKESSEKKEDEILIQTKIASNADNNEPTPCENLAPGGSEVLGESKSGNPLELEKRQRVTSDEILNNETDMTPLDETASRHGEANPDEADETPEPTTEIISPNVLETRSLTRARRNLLREQKKTDTTPLDVTASKHGEANPIK